MKSLYFISLILTLTEQFNSIPVRSFYENRCQSKICKQSARFMHEAIDESISPCDDFYQYACGGWLQKNQIPDSKPIYSTTIEASDIMTEQIRIRLELNETSKHSSKSVQLAKFIYDQCLSAEKTDIYSLVKKSLFKSLNNHKRKWYQIYLEQLKYGYIIEGGLFRLEVLTNPANTSNYILALDADEYFIDDDEDELRPTIIQAYRRYLKYIIQLIPNLEADVDKIIEEILELEIKLSQMKMPLTSRRDPKQIINILTYELFNDVTNFNWHKNLFVPIMNNFNLPLNLLSTELLIIDVDYFIRLIKYIENISPKTIEVYFGLQKIKEYVPFLNEKYRQHLYDFLKIKYGVRVTPRRWRTCYHQVQKLFPWTMSRLYIDDRFQNYNSSQAKHIIDRIHLAFIEMIELDSPETSWIDAEVRRIFLKKLHHIRKNVAYPDWLTDDARLDSFNNWSETVEKSFDNYLIILNRFKWNQMRANLERLEFSPKFVVDEWAIEPARINAAYSLEDNTITIPAAILNPPFFQVGLPISMNYGGIGAVVGHELTHSLDDEGRYFDHEGNYNDPWNMSMTNSFLKHSECLVKQYSNITEPITQLKLNGNITLGENIADNGGLREAFRAFKLEQIRNPIAANEILADLPGFTPEQLFFIANAQTWCTKIRPEALRIKINSDPHVPAKYRVNVPLSNLVNFSQAFNCKDGSRMNPIHKCILW